MGMTEFSLRSWGDGHQEASSRSPQKRELLPKPPLSLGGRTPVWHRGLDFAFGSGASVYILAVLGELS